MKMDGYSKLEAHMKKKGKKLDRSKLGESSGNGGKKVFERYNNDKKKGNMDYGNKKGY